MPNRSPSLDEVLRALADPVRRSLIERLVHAPATVSQLAQPLEMSLPAVMQHLAVLEGSGLIRSEKLGRVRTCQVEPHGLRTAEQWLGAQRTAWEDRLDRLGRHLAAQAPEKPRSTGRD